MKLSERIFQESVQRIKKDTINDMITYGEAMYVSPIEGAMREIAWEAWKKRSMIKKGDDIINESGMFDQWFDANLPDGYTKHHLSEPYVGDSNATLTR